MFDDMNPDVFEIEEKRIEEEDKKAKKKGKKKSAKLSAEYDEAFDGEEKMMHKLSTIKSEINVVQKEIEIDSVIISNFKKIGRTDSISGLTGVVSEWNVVSPIHVLALEDDDCYQLLDGLRRIFAALRAGKKTIKAMVWEFSDRREGKELANIISLMINRNQKYTPKEMWEQMKVLESVNDAAPGLIEYLLQMEPGDAMKLKDVMLADACYDDFRDGLLNGKYSIEQAYKKLCNERKKEEKLEKEDRLSLDADGLKTTSPLGYDSFENGDEPERLSAKEAKEILEMSDLNDDVEDETFDSLDRTNEIRKDDLHQKVGERTFVDASVKKATLIRDGNKCRCCGIGGEAWAGILVYHHLIPVYAGGPDTVDNGLTLCVNCHLTLHNYITGDVQKPDNMEPEQEAILMKIMKFGNIALDASNKLGMKREELKKANASSKKHPMPNANVKMNKEALEEAEKLKGQGELYEDGEEIDSEIFEDLGADD